MILNTNLLVIITCLLLNISGRPIKSTSSDMVGNLNELMPAAEEISRKKLEAIDDEIEDDYSMPSLKESSSPKSKLSGDEYEEELPQSRKSLLKSQKQSVQGDEDTAPVMEKGSKLRPLRDAKPKATPKGGFKKFKPSSSSTAADTEDSLEELEPSKEVSPHKSPEIAEDGEYEPSAKEKPLNQSQSQEELYENELSPPEEDPSNPTKENFRDEEGELPTSKDSSKRKTSKDIKSRPKSKGGLKKSKSASLNDPKASAKSEKSSELHKKPSNPDKTSTKETSEVDYIEQLEQLTNTANEFIESNNFKSIAAGMLKEKIDDIVNDKGEVIMNNVKDSIDKYLPEFIEDFQSNVEGIELGMVAGVAGKLMNWF